MSYSQQTTNLTLPLFVDSDKPTWRGDWNEAMNKIDTGVEGAMESAELLSELGVTDSTSAAELKQQIATGVSASDNLASMGVTGTATAEAFKAKVDAAQNETQVSAAISSYVTAQKDAGNLIGQSYCYSKSEADAEFIDSAELSAGVTSGIQSALTAGTIIGPDALSAYAKSADVYTSAQADARFLTQTSASNTYLTKSDASSTYLTTATADSTYATRAYVSSYTLSSADLATHYAAISQSTIGFTLSASGESGTYTINTGLSDSWSIHVSLASGETLVMSGYASKDHIHFDTISFESSLSTSTVFDSFYLSNNLNQPAEGRVALNLPKIVAMDGTSVLYATMTPTIQSYRYLYLTPTLVSGSVTYNKCNVYDLDIALCSVLSAG